MCNTIHYQVNKSQINFWWVCKYTTIMTINVIVPWENGNLPEDPPLSFCNVYQMLLHLTTETLDEAHSLLL